MILAIKILATITAFFASACFAYCVGVSNRDCGEIPWDIVAFLGSMVILNLGVWI
jgi:hypothetical protein